MSGPSDIGTPPELAWLPVDKLDVDPSYQRTLDTPRSRKLIERIAANFRWASFQAILATPTGEGDNRRWLVIDGQHRVAAARLRGIGHIPAVVVAGLGPAEQAAAFVGANRDRATVSAQALFHARLVAGDPDAAVVKRLCDGQGIAIERHNKAVRQLAAGHTAAVPALLVILRGMGEATLGAAIRSVAICWRHQAGALSGALFRGAALYLSEGGSPAALEAAMRQLGIRRIEELVSKVGTNSGGRALADALKRVMPTGRSSQPAAVAAPVAQPAPAPPLKTGPFPAAPKTGGFQDDPRARADRGSHGPISREPVFGRSVTGSSL